VGDTGSVIALGASGETLAKKHSQASTRVCTLGVSDQALGGVVIATVEGQIGRIFTGLRENADISTNWVNTGSHITQYGNGKTTSYRACQNDPATETYAAAIAGTYDASWTTLVTNIRNSGKWTPTNPFILCYGHETTVAQWAPLGTAQQFIDAYRHFRNLTDSLGATVRTKNGTYQGGCIVMAYVGWDRMFVGANGIGPPTAGQGVDDYDPDKGSSPAPAGSSYYEYLGSDVYNVLDSPGVLRYGTDALTLLAPLVNAAVARNKDFIIGEMGCPDGATSQDHTNKALWLDSLRLGLIARGRYKPGVCRALLTTVKASVENYNVDSSAESLAAFQRLGASTYFK
jgi:hypothetical protein